MNTFDFLTNIEFGKAAAKAFGLDPMLVHRAEVNTGDINAPFSITFGVLLTAADLVRIGEIMNEGVLQVAVSGKVEYNDIVQHIDASARDPYAREVQHVDTPDEEPAGIPPHVYLYRNMLTDTQRLAPLGIDETNGQYAVAIDDLDQDQRRIPHVSKQLRTMGVEPDFMQQEVNLAMGIQPGMLHVAVDVPVGEKDIVRREV